MKSMRRVFLVSLIAMLVGCSLIIPKETQYLRAAQGQATQAQVKQHLGVPKTTKVSQAGETIWVYEVRELEPGGQNTWVAAGSWCDEYALTFDENGVLQAWTHKSFFHGGENMPASCNTTIGVQKPAL
jgi:hypothetical protein